MASQKDQRSPAGRDKIKEGSRSEEIPKKVPEGIKEKQTTSPEPKDADLMKKELEALKKSLEEEKRKAEQYLDSLKYLKAEFENYQKRTAKEMDELAKRGSERLARKLLGTVDDFDRTINASKAIGDQSKLLAGVEMILKELLKILRSEGVVRMVAVGKKFDPQLHESVAVIQTGNCPPGTIVEELRPGYMFDGRVIRPSMVTVASAPEKPGGVESEGQDKSGNASEKSVGTEEEKATRE